MTIRTFVDLYRRSGKPGLVDGCFAATIEYEGAKDLLARIYAKNSSSIRSCRVDGQFVMESVDLPDSGSKVEFEILVPSNTDSRFYQSLCDMLNKSPRVSQGILPSEYYLVQEDFYSLEADDNSEISNGLVKTCELIRYLVNLSHYKDKTNAQLGERLVFVKHESDRHDIPIVIETKVVSSVVYAASAISLDIVRSLCDDSQYEDPHYTARLGVFHTSIAEFCNRSVDNEAENFKKLVVEWDEFLRLYHNNLEVYLSGFAFQKAKKEVADAELELAASYSKVLSDISGKLLAIPASFAGLVALLKVEGIAQQFLSVLALVGAALIVAASVVNQKRQFKQVRHARRIVSDSLEGESARYPEDLKSRIQEMNKSLDRGERWIGNMLFGMRFLGWMPALIGTFIYYELNGGRDAFNQGVNLISMMLVKSLS